MRNFLVAGNWKMNGSTESSKERVTDILAGVTATDRVELLVCPPFPYLACVAEQVAASAVSLGAQNVSQHRSGAFTGEVAPGMLVDIGCKYVIVGHSERRTLFAETNEVVAEKFQAALNAGLKPILCVGETLEERESGRTEGVIDTQLAAVLDTAGIDGLADAVVAYEPIWAIGTGMTASPEQAQEVHRHIRTEIGKRNADIAAATQILYGGSMKGENAAGLLTMPDIDGGLIGGASLKAGEFLAIADAAAQG